MVKGKKSNVKKWGIISSVLTCVIMVSYLVICLTSAETMSKCVAKVKDIMQSIFSIEESAPEKISIYVKDSMIFANEGCKYSINVVPSNASKEVIFETDSENCTIDDNGTVHYFGTEKETIMVTARSKKNENVKCKAYLYGRGLSPDDHRINALQTSFYSDNSLKNKINEREVALNEKYYMATYASIKDEYLAELNLSKNYNKLLINVYYELAENNEEIYIKKGGNQITFKNIGDYNLQLGYCTSKKIFNAKSQNISLKVGESGNYSPERFIEPSINVKYESFDKLSDNEYQIVLPAKTSYFEIQPKHNASYNTMANIELDNVYEGKVVQENGRFYRKTNACDFDVKMTSVVDKNMVTTVHFTFLKDTPKKLTVYASDKITIFSKSLNYTCQYDTKTDFSHPINVTVLEGQDVIETFPNSNKIKLKKFGTVTLRFALAEDPEVYFDKTFEIVYINSISTFISKIMGHMLVFLALGITLTLAVKSFLKNKKLAKVIVPVTLFLYSALSEILQGQPFNNRGNSIYDVFFNFAYALIGMLIVYLIAFVSKTIKRKNHSKCLNLSFDNI